MSKRMEFYPMFSHVRNALKIALICVGVLLSLSGCERITDPMLPEVSTPDETEPLTVMTYNVYVGGNAEAVLAVESPLGVPDAVTAMYNEVIASDFHGRAAAIAASIKTYQPHLIGLQEISLIRKQSPGDVLLGGDVPAEEIVLDFLEILMDALHAEGLDYQIAASVENLDVEMPMFAETGVDDVRLTDRDVILARSDVPVSRPVNANFAAALTVETLGLVIDRGYNAVDATVGGTTYRFVNTHLEAFTEEHRVAQAQELADILSTETLPIILLGDFNTEAPEGAAYQLLLASGYTDTWQPDSEGTGFTCCQAADIRNAESAHNVRIDQIFVRNITTATAIVTHTIGDTPADRLPAGLWPSDHAGVVAQISFE